MSDATLHSETDKMGRITVTADVSNLEDLWRAERGEIAADEVRSLHVDDAIIDTGCVSLGLPERTIAELGLRQVRTRKMRTTKGPREAPVFQAVRLAVQDRDCIVEVYGIPDDCPPLIGQNPLESMDFVVDPGGQRLIGNPDHDGEWVAEFY